MLLHFIRHFELIFFNARRFPWWFISRAWIEATGECESTLCWWFGSRRSIAAAWFASKGRTMGTVISRKWKMIKKLSLSSKGTEKLHNQDFFWKPPHVYFMLPFMKAESYCFFPIIRNYLKGIKWRKSYAISWQTLRLLITQPLNSNFQKMHFYELDSLCIQTCKYIIEIYGPK